MSNEENYYSRRNIIGGIGATLVTTALNPGLCLRKLLRLRLSQGSQSLCKIRRKNIPSLRLRDSLNPGQDLPVKCSHLLIMEKKLTEVRGVF